MVSIFAVVYAPVRGGVRIGDAIIAYYCILLPLTAGLYTFGSFFVTKQHETESDMIDPNVSLCARACVDDAAQQK